MLRSRSLRLVAGTVVVLVLLAASPVAAASKKGAGGSSGAGCNPRKASCVTDSTAPEVDITSPASGTTVDGGFDVIGTAADDQTVSAVDVRVGDGPWERASGTTSWIASVEVASATGGSATVTARATDTAGLTTTTSITVDVAPSADATAPTLAITAPADGAEVSGLVTVSGSADDDDSVATVHVRADDGTPTVASGTTSWSHALDTTQLADGGHVITVTATDPTGNVTSTSVSVNVSNGSTPGGADWTIDDPSASYSLLPLGRTRLPEWGSVTGVLYTEQFTNRRAVAFRDAHSGATSYVDLPTDTLAGWSGAATVMTSAQDLWVFGGTGPMQARHYRLHGSPLPASATLVESRVLGDADSRAGDMIALTGGGVVVAWHQHGSSGPQGQHVSYRSPSGQWQDLPALTFMPTKSSDQVLGQHPADGSIWLFSNPDAWGAIGAAHLTEADGSLTVDWTDSTYLDTVEHGLNGPDPENPHLALAVDQARGTMHLAYQSADRQRFTDGSRFAVGSRVAIADIAVSGAVSFLVVPVWAERVAPLGLVVEDGEHVISYRPVDEATLTFDEAHVRRHRAGAWEPALVLGRMAVADPVTVATSRAELSARLSDGRIHLRTF